MFDKVTTRHGGMGRMAGFAAIGLAAGLAANFGRKLAVQGPSMLQGDWIEALKAEHAAVLKLFDALEGTDTDQPRKRSLLLMQIKHALGKHAFEEENVIYPALREHGFVTEAASLVVDHGDVKHFLFELDSMPNDSSDFLPKVRVFREDLERHMHEEEETIFPMFDAALTDEQRHKLTVNMNREGFKLA
ncbi:MAG: hemerythrin domain-containing protein [Alphaproteobacteria bacterium]|nr:hemerythrin domain-containing protein [Alphaproteobacteria bacterium]MBU0794038.1 hemerythrin domain-containing protein [Alphaproteobacteria bacterium]MBU0877393.1 hemerythrin domain-containing protein [Alphaproteobacteria bacterium]MBU1770260.1 hemerythrin domain-containing protein [Alphaproteobacteria bacterium]